MRYFPQSIVIPDALAIPGMDDFVLTPDLRVVRVRSVSIRWLGKALKGTVTKNGYTRLQLWNNGTPTGVFLHRIICTVFHGPPTAEKPFVRHLNGNPSDNKPENLRWGSQADNAVDKIAHGRSNPGEKSWNAKFTDADILAIRAAHKNGRSARKLVKDFARLNVTKSAIQSVLSGRSWKHVKPTIKAEAQQ